MPTQPNTSKCDDYFDYLKYIFICSYMNYIKIHHILQFRDVCICFNEIDEVI